MVVAAVVEAVVTAAVVMVVAGELSVEAGSGLNAICGH